MTDKSLTEAEVVEMGRLFCNVVVPVMAKEHAAEDGRAGAVLELRRFDNELLLVLPAGEMTKEKQAAFETNAGAKNDALENHPAIVASWEVHQGDLSQPPYPGAIRTAEDDRISISGFSWQRDMVGSIWLARKFERISLEEAVAIALRCGIEEEFNSLSEKLDQYNTR